MAVHLVAHNGNPIKKRSAHKRPFFAYYYKYGKQLGVDKVGRATKLPKAVASAVRRMIDEHISYVEIYLDNEHPVARINRRQGRIHIQLLTLKHLES